MEEVLLARWQFGITTVYHWLFVPITLGITWMVAIMETAWVRTKKPEYLRMTMFWGKLMLINLAVFLFQFALGPENEFAGLTYRAPAAGSLAAPVGVAAHKVVAIGPQAM